MSDILTKAYKEVDQQISALTALRNAMRAAGYVPITTPFSAPDRPKFKAKKRSKMAHPKTGLASRLVELITDARQPLTTKAIYDRLVETGWAFNPKLATPAPILVGASLANLAKTGRIEKVGTEWQRT